MTACRPLNGLLAALFPAMPELWHSVHDTPVLPYHPVVVPVATLLLWQSTSLGEDDLKAIDLLLKE